MRARLAGRACRGSAVGACEDGFGPHRGGGQGMAIVLAMVMLMVLVIAIVIVIEIVIAFENLIEKVNCL